MSKRPSAWEQLIGERDWSLRSWLRDHARTLAETASFVSQRLGTSMVVWLLVGIALALPGGLRLVQMNMQVLGADWQGRLGMTIYFVPATPAAVIDEVRATLAEDPVVDKLSLKSADEALQEFLAEGSQTDVIRSALALIDDNPLPASIKVMIKTEGELGELDRLQVQYSRHVHVDEAVLERTWLERLRDMTQIVQRLGALLAVLFGVAAVLVTGASVRLAIEARLEELRVLHLVGATPRQIRRPFLYFGAFYGLGGAVIAAMLLALALSVIEQPLETLLGSYQVPLRVVGFDAEFLGRLLLVGGALGVFGARLAASQRIRDLESA